MNAFACQLKEFLKSSPSNKWSVALLIKNLLQIGSIVLSRDIFLSREVIPKLAMWMGYWVGEWVAMRWEKQNLFYSRLVTRERVKKLSQNFYEVAWMSFQENVREENSVCERLVAHTWWSDYFDPE